MADGYEIDLDRAPQILANLKNAHDSIVEIQAEARQLARYSLRGTDGVSRHASAELQRFATNPESGSLFEAITAYMTALKDQIHALEDNLARYQDLEELNQIKATPIN
ncbi:hypothetical protein FHR81_003953 [Actinoalloteichus hoggarensis]|uniref:Uncharacterized protein n=1 Tax=Actinoalloteichus hoggarensis TaxID=1470176 RepID=A0A221VW44_9PSEU|nr:hypothetical protein [Actinoalloteichus hoggarensis]ASO17769.1 hypothetical protein AHOG_00480 [Actinoalloteichus hoggarensis]MBB5922896.1 hypothetical protein [Actinoalloteichus hoggarensis]